MHSPPKLPEVPFRIVALALQELNFKRLEGAPPKGPHETPVEFTLAVGEPSSGALPIQLTVQMEEKDAFRVLVTYSVVIQQLQEVPEEEREQTWRVLAARIAPTVMYPYIRETISSLVQKAAFPSFIAPIINFAKLIPPEEIVFSATAEDVHPAGDDS